MSDIIDLHEFKKRLLETSNTLMPEHNGDIDPNVIKITDDIANKYIAWFNSINHSFDLQCTPEQGKLIQSKIDELRNDYSLKIIELIGELAEREVRIYLLDKNR